MKAIFYSVIFTGFIGGVVIMFGSLIAVMKLQDPIVYLFFIPTVMILVFVLKIEGFIGGKK
jgi:hypothetical protein